MLAIKSVFSVGLVVVLLGVAGVGANSQKAHVHGVGKLNVAVEGKTAVVEVIAPAESIYGFEHEASSVEDKKKQAAAFDILRAKAGEMLVFEPDRGCEVKHTNIEVVSEERGDDDHEAATKDGEPHADKQVSHAHEQRAEHGHHEEKTAQHSEVHAEFSIECREPLKGSQVEVAIGKFFPDLEKLEAQVLSEARPYGVEIGRKAQKLDL